MHGFFGEIQISEEAHQRRQNPARFRSVKSFNGPAQLFGNRRRHLRQPSKPRRQTQLHSGFPYPQFIGVTISCPSSKREGWRNVKGSSENGGNHSPTSLTRSTGTFLNHRVT